MTLQDLNNEYFELYGELYQARALLTDKQYKVTADVLLTSYKDDLEACISQKMLAVGKERFELKFKVRNWLPHRFLFFWNKTAKKLLKQYVADFKAELQRLEQNVAAQPTNSDEETDQLPVQQ